MKLFLLIIVIVLAPASAMTHNPLTAKFELDVLKEGALLNISTSQTGLHQALIKYYPKIDFSTISVRDYKKLTVAYLKKHLFLTTGDTILKIGKGGIKLGSHQTDLKFLIENYPKNVENLEVKIDAFRENENHHSVFWWNKISGRSKVVLSEKNDFQSAFQGVEQVMLNASMPTNGLWLLGLTSLLSAIFVFYRKIGSC